MILKLENSQKNIIFKNQFFGTYCFKIDHSGELTNKYTYTAFF